MRFNRSLKNFVRLMQPMDYLRRNGVRLKKKNIMVDLTGHTHRPSNLRSKREYVPPLMLAKGRGKGLADEDMHYQEGYANSDGHNNESNFQDDENDNEMEAHTTVQGDASGGDQSTSKKKARDEKKEEETNVKKLLD
ncbi:uncharacterized protein LOC110713017 isoform X3 [Chenopodium quinoa]|uniref:uncharacterized protein LOC110713017 isoform X3 n=1 Tax=Chenopodium quinoa TaxID=63459 RepID=UPI000B78D142|nr:uncharacterized protein LOC110713017 isoform X3 [Chenopodium quinoa]